MKYIPTLIALAAASMSHGYKPFSDRAVKVQRSGPGNAKSYFDRPGSGLLTRKEIESRRGGNPKGAY